MLKILFALTFAIVVLSHNPAAAQSSRECQPYHSSTTGATGGPVPVVPDSLLADIKIAIPCLIDVITGLKGQIIEPKLPGEAGSKLLSATGALRAIMTRQSNLDAGSGNPRETKALNEFIRLFRTHDGIDVTSVLTYAARSDVYDARLNAVLLLGNIIDNTTVCVPLVHLNDPALTATDYGINGRANLLGIISVVAPWAYAENYAAIKATVAKIRRNTETATGVETTRNLLDNIDSRLGLQTEKTNKSVALPDAFRAPCKSYVLSYRPSIENLGFSY